MQEAKVIKTEEQYHCYLDDIQELMSKGQSLTSEESDRLEILTVLLEVYENNKYPIEVQDPIEAIQFRMAEKGLKQADLIPYFGTSGRVSEVLNKKRELTVPMIKALSVGLGISSDTLLGLNFNDNLEARNESINWDKFPITEMAKRGWIEKIKTGTKNSVEDLVKNFISDAGLQFGSASFRRTLAGEAKSPTTTYALYAWLARVILKARSKKESLGKFDPENLSSSFLRDVAQFSWSDNGPMMAVEFLEKHGIAVIFEPHLKGTLLDGAALKDLDGTPIIGITLRYDRLDNFWFTLLHELAHVWKHLDVDTAFLDDNESSSEDRREIEANRLAKEAFIPRLIWKRSDVVATSSRESVLRLSKELKIHPAIVAGRLRKEIGNYQIFNDLLGHGVLRPIFFNNLISN
ncbi:ImmA/IrrE family metallo-endopeptidase [Methylophilus sp. QUAN]|uniref:ImmA/IrrE family metallo-endopeptidase n=1 Tax=Methylophilus sp. QUAN TaxID=2781020 RepID=UPI0018905D65|nr:ImmA/IrrE family metallo-endopeptidase [Methylophilus sp. QUAN]MBF4991152.1 ImmA/IrrE family metallo-endopeptidase [Methylophilus sp. QUAN]